MEIVDSSHSYEKKKKKSSLHSILERNFQISSIQERTPSLYIILFEKNLLYSKNATPFNIYVRHCSRRNSRLRDGIILFKIISLDKF